MRRAASLAALLLTFACKKTVQTVEPPKPDPMRFVGGIQVNEPDHLVWATRVAEAGLDTVAVTVYAKQGDWDSSKLWFEDEEQAVVSEMRMAKTLGSKVVLILRVALDHAFVANRHLWHGMVLPRTDEALDAWFATYGDFVEKWATIAAREGVDVLGVASEMSSLTNTRPIARIPDLEAYYLDADKQAEYRAIVTSDPRVTPALLAAAGAGDYVEADAFLAARSAAWREWAEVSAQTSSDDPVASINRRRARLEAGWRAVIARARERFDGPLTYAANFDQYASVGFWDALDIIGINAYFPLRDRLDTPSVEARDAALVRGWERVFEGIDAFRARSDLKDRPVLFTELGYTRRAGSTAAPWASGAFEVLRLGDRDKLVVWGEQPIDPTERAASVRALAAVTRDHDDFIGALYWKLSTIAGHRAIEPFVLVLDPAGSDPLLDALRAL